MRCAPRLSPPSGPSCSSSNESSGDHTGQVAPSRSSRYTGGRTRRGPGPDGDLLLSHFPPSGPRSDCVPHGTLPRRMPTTPAPTATHDHRPKAKLLAAAVDHILEHGLSDLSLRELATAIGTSHRMLIYHFGSREGLVVAVIQTVEEAQRAAFADLDTEDLSPRRRHARRCGSDSRTRRSDRTSVSSSRSTARRCRDDPARSRCSTGSSTTGSSRPRRTAIERGTSPDVARAEARLSVAVIRGLLLDWLATGDRAAVDAASNASSPSPPENAPRD